MGNKCLDYFRSAEKINVGGTNLRIEHSGLENLTGLLLAGGALVVLSPILVPRLLYTFREECYRKFKGYFSHEKDK